MAKNIDSRIMHKHDTEENWKKAINFIPKSGELIIYDTDENHPFPRTKIGNGILKINELPFSSFSIENYRKTVSQNLILSLSDISLDSHKIGVNLRSKNLIPYPYTFTDGEIHNGITFMKTNDGGIHISGTPTTQWFSFVFCRKPAAIITPEAGLYTASVGNVERVSLMVNAHETESDTSQIYFNTQDGMPKTVKIDRNVNVFRLAVHSDTLAPIDVTIYPQLEYGTVATPYTPYVADDTAVTVKSCGKNLIPYPYTNTTGTKNGVTFTDNGDGSWTLNGTSPDDKLTTYIIANGNIFSGYVACKVGESATSEGLCISLTADKNADVKLAYEVAVGGQLYILIGKGVTCDNITVYPQLEVGTVATPYEPYIEGETIETILKDGAELTSISPNMTISSSIEGVVVEATYNSMCFDEKWNGLINSAIDAISNSDIDKLFIDTKGGVDR